jgi:hypothetical protein
MQTPLIPSRLAIPAALPPAYELVLAAGEGAHDTACRIAPERGAGAFVWAPHAHVLDFAVVLEPDEPLRTARRAFIAGMGALADAVAAYCPPEKPVAILWPDTLVFNVARLGGGRLGIPDGCGEDDVPDWLVVSAQLLASKADFGDPGLTPDSTSLEEEGFDPDEFTALAESFARHLMLAFDTWNERGFKAVAEGFLARLPEAAPGERRAIDESGDLLARAPGSAAAPTRTRLAPALAEPAWFDPATGMVRL